MKLSWPGDFLGKIIQGDCLEVMRQMPDGCIDIAFTSPPYNLGKMRKGGFYRGKDRTLEYDKHEDDMPDAKYKEWQHLVIMEMYRLVSANGVIFYNHKPRTINGVYDSRRDLIPLSVRQEIVWDRCGAVNFRGTFFAPQTERIFVIAKGSWRVHQEYVSLGDVWRVPPETGTEHPAPYPKKLVQMAINAACSARGVVFDPFMGSGTTAMAAIELGRSWCGIELSGEYCAIARKRIAAEQSQGKLF